MTSFVGKVLGRVPSGDLPCMGSSTLFQAILIPLFIFFPLSLFLPFILFSLSFSLLPFFLFIFFFSNLYNQYYVTTFILNYCMHFCLCHYAIVIKIKINIMSYSKNIDHSATSEGENVFTSIEVNQELIYLCMLLSIYYKHQNSRFLDLYFREFTAAINFPLAKPRSGILEYVVFSKMPPGVEIIITTNVENYTN